MNSNAYGHRTIELVPSTAFHFGAMEHGLYKKTLNNNSGESIIVITLSASGSNCWNKWYHDIVQANPFETAVTFSSGYIHLKDVFACIFGSSSLRVTQENITHIQYSASFAQHTSTALYPYDTFG